MSDKISKMSDDTNLDSSIIKMLYYNKYDGKLPKLTVSQLLDFIANDVANNETFSDHLGSDITDKIDMLKKFSSKKSLTKKMNATELADFIGMNKSDVNQIVLYYFTKKGGIDTGKMTISEFADFIINDVSKDDTYSSMFDSDTIEKVKQMQTYTDVSTMQKKQDYKGIASFLDIDKSIAMLLFVYYQSQDKNYIPDKMTITDFVSFVKSDIANNVMFSSYITSDTLSQINMISTFTDKDYIQAKQSSFELASDLSIDEATIEQITSLYYANDKNDKSTKLSLSQIVNYMLSNDTIKSTLNANQISQLSFLQMIMNSVINNKLYSYEQIAKLAGMNTANAKIIYTYKFAISNDLSNLKLSIQTVINYMISNSNILSSMMNSSEISQLKLAQTIINSSIKKTEYTSSELAKILSMKNKQIDKLYMLYIDDKGDTSSWQISPKSFVDFVVSDVISNDTFSSQFNNDDKSDIKNAQTIINAVISNTKYTPQKATKLIRNFSNEIDENEIKLLYTYYAGINLSDATQTMTIESLINYLVNDLMKDDEFKSVFDDDTKQKLTDMQSEINDGISQLKGKNYSRVVIVTDYHEESDDTLTFLDEIDSIRSQYLNKESYVVGESAMVHELHKTFGSEYNIITILTALAIFLVVLITFKSVIIPILLVLLVECGVFITVASIGIAGNSIHYLALLVVQSILMGATIDYAIVLTNYYRESRSKSDVNSSIVAAYNGSINTVMTSGIILIIVTGIIGIFAKQNVAEVCRTISIGSFTAVMLILFVLPSILALFDKLIVRTHIKHNKHSF